MVQVRKTSGKKNKEEGRTRVRENCRTAERAFEYPNRRQHEPGPDLNEGGLWWPVRL